MLLSERERWFCRRLYGKLVFE